MLLSKKIRVLVVDDSAIVRKILSETISAEQDMEVVGTAPDPFVARDKILALAPDVITLDIEMPRMNGLTFLKKVMQYRPMPVIVISSLLQSSCEKALEAIESGAVDTLPKPGGPYSVGDLKNILPDKIRAAAIARIRTSPHPPAPKAEKAPVYSRPSIASASRTDTVIAIGASTGGTEAIREVLCGLTSDCPPIVVAQHIPPVFSQAFAERLNRVSALRVKEARDGDALVPGEVLIAPGDFHMTLHKSPGHYTVQVVGGPKVNYQRPSIDVLFSSVAYSAGSNAIGVLLTGMGSDGAQGLLQIKNAGGRTIAQDEQSCIVYGMPREAVRLKAAQRVLPLGEIAANINQQRCLTSADV